jgi:NitT/TauT family transport system permease protein
MKTKASFFWQRVFPPAILFGFVVIVWQIVTLAYDIPRYLLPSPLLILQAAVDQHEQFLSATLLTGFEAVCGFGLSLLIGVGIAFAFSQSKIIRSSCYPYAIFLQTVPIIAIAPLIITWFGTGFQSVLLVAVIISLFPIITNATTGLISVDPELENLFRLYNASRWQRLWKLQLPNSVPYIIVGAKTSSGLAVIGSIVGEFFAGYQADQFGLGYLILQTSNQLKTPQLFAAVIASTLLGVIIFGTVSFVGSVILKRFYALSSDAV